MVDALGVKNKSKIWLDLKSLFGVTCEYTCFIERAYGFEDSQRIDRIASADDEMFAI